MLLTPISIDAKDVGLLTPVGWLKEKTHLVVINIGLLILLMSHTPAESRPSLTPSRGRREVANDVIPAHVLLNTTYQDWQQERIESIKREILDKLGMSDLPNVSNVNTSVEEHREILRKYKRSVEEVHGKTFQHFNELDYANTFDFFVDTGDSPSVVDNATWRNRDKMRVYFSTNISEPSDARKETVVTSAILKLYKKAIHIDELMTDNVVAVSMRFDVFQILDIQAGDRTIRRLVDSRIVSLRETAGWEEFSVSRAVQDWIRDSSTNLGLEIEAAVTLRRPLRVYVEFVTPLNVVTPERTATYPEADDNDLSKHRSQYDLMPALHVLTQHRPVLGSGAMSGKRTRREIEETTHRPADLDLGDDCLPSDVEERCCRYPLTVSFRDIGWHTWIIQPESYEAYYCYGSCPYGHRVAHMFGTVKSMMLEIHPNSVLSMDCAATRVGPLNIAHYNSEGRLVVSVFESMVTEECSCI